MQFVFLFSFCSPDLPEQLRIENSFYEYASRSITTLFILAPTHLKYHKSVQRKKKFQMIQNICNPFIMARMHWKNPKNNRAMFIPDTRVDVLAWRLSDLQYWSL